MTGWRAIDPTVRNPLIAGTGGLAAVAAGAILAPSTAIGSWLSADLAILGLSLGAFLILMIHALTGGRWGSALRPSLAAMGAALPLPLFGMFLPIAGIGKVLSWTAAPASVLPEEARKKLAYLDPTFVIGRTIIIAAIWLVIAWAAGQFSRSDRAASKSWSIVGLVAYAITMTFFATDWMIALDPEFYSTIYPMLEAGGELAGAFAAAVLALYLVAAPAFREETAEGIRLGEDLANLLFGFVLLWVYLAFMQWLIVWSGDLPEEIGWYMVRSAGIWPLVLAAIVVLHALIPITGFLSRRLKRSPRGVALLAACVLVGHLLDVVWRIEPAFPTGMLGALMTIAAFVALGGLWLAAVRWLMTRQPVRKRESAHG